MLIEDGDEIAVSVSRGSLELPVDSQALESRKQKWQPIKKEAKKQVAETICNLSKQCRTRRSAKNGALRNSSGQK